MIEEIRELYAYTTWANDRVLDVVAELDAAAFAKDLGSSFPSVRETLVHLLAVDWVWLARWRGGSPTATPESWDLSSFDAIRAQWTEVQRERAAFLAGLSDADLERPLAYRTRKGEAHVNTYGEMLRHVVNHTTHHRGQIVTMLRQLGRPGVDTDLIVFYWQRAAGDVAAER